MKIVNMTKIELLGRLRIISMGIMHAKDMHDIALQKELIDKIYIDIEDLIEDILIPQVEN